MCRKVVITWLLLVAGIAVAFGCGEKKSKSDAARLAEAIDDPDRHARRLDRECAEGRPASCTSVGVQTAWGTFGRTKDHSAAIPFLEKGCHGGDPLGCKELGVMYENGRGVAKDHQKAAELYRGACEGGVAEACHSLGVYYRHGRGVEKDAVESRRYFQKACDAGSQSSCP